MLSHDRRTSSCKLSVHAPRTSKKAVPKGGLRANDDAFQIVGFQGIGISR
jgi:hypothetical protein